MATSTQRMHPAIQRYLTELETKLRQTPGIAPEEALADAQEFLLSEWEELSRKGTALSDDDVYQRFIEKFGSPEDIAGDYAQLQEPAATKPSDARIRKRKSIVRLLIGSACVLAACGHLTWSGRYSSFAGR